MLCQQASLASAVFLALLPPCLVARNIAFPPVAPVQANLNDVDSPNHYQSYQSSLGLDKDQFLSYNKFAGLTTFANLPWVHCLSKDGDVEKGSRRISAEAAWSAYTHNNTFLSWAKIVDCGDAPLTFLDNTVALQQLGEAHKAVSARTANTTEVAGVPRIITLGGDHTTTLAALRSTFDHWGPVSVIHFDSHLDTWDPTVLGGGISHYAGVNHGTFLHIAHEEGLILNSSAHAGIRAPAINKKYDWKNDKRCGFEIITARDIDRIGVMGIIDRLKARVGDTPVYISVDIDVLDPAFAPATGTAEVGGWTTRELLSILDGLEGLKVIGADVVEVAPVYDTAGETTGLAAAEVAHSLMSLMVETPVKPLKERS
ncbi:Arginase/deacetylase, partial [Aureobasidium melanogenum]